MHYPIGDSSLYPQTCCGHVIEKEHGRQLPEPSSEVVGGSNVFQVCWKVHESHMDEEQQEDEETEELGENSCLS